MIRIVSILTLRLHHRKVLSRDRTELNDLAKQRPEQLAELAGKWQRWGEENYVTPMPRDYGVRYLRPGR